MRIRAFLLLGLLPLYFGACSSMKVIPATDVSAESSRELYYFEPESRISYRVYHGPDTLHLKLKTDQRSTIVKMVRQGTKVYFDLEGKKKKKVFVNYPLPGQMQQSRQDVGLQGVSPVSADGQRPGIEMMLRRIPKDLLFVYNGKEELIHSSSGFSGDISCSLSMEKQKYLVYELKIPFSKIVEGGLNSVSSLSIGIEAKGMDMSGGSSMRPAASMGRPGSMGGGGRRPGGRSPGGMSPGRRPSGMGNGASGQMDREAMTSTTEIWFQVNLIK